MKKYTIIKPDPTLRANLMAFGWECGEGWYPLIEKLLDSLEKIENKKKLGLEITQIKEKWGILTIYTNIYNEKIQDLIDKAQLKSKTICEICGKSGKLRESYGWLKTRCNECFKNEEKT